MYVVKEEMGDFYPLKNWYDCEAYCWLNTKLWIADCLCPSSGVAVNVHDLAPSCAGSLFGQSAI